MIIRPYEFYFFVGTNRNRRGRFQTCPERTERRAGLEPAPTGFILPHTKMEKPPFSLVIDGQNVL